MTLTLTYNLMIPLILTVISCSLLLLGLGAAHEARRARKERVKIRIKQIEKAITHSPSSKTRTEAIEYLRSFSSELFEGLSERELDQLRGEK